MSKHSEKKEEKKKKKEVKKTSQAHKEKKIKKFFKKAAVKLKATGQNAVFAPLLPLKPTMVKRLKEQNITHDNTIHDVAIKFVKHIVGASHFEEMKFETLYADEKSSGTSVANAAAGAAVGDYAGAAKNLITAIVNYFKKLKDKKTKNEPLSETEKDSLKGSDDAANAIVSATDEDESKGNIVGNIQEWIMENKTMVFLIVGASAAAYFIFKNKKAA
jgi:hypothetical protein